MIWVLGEVFVHDTYFQSIEGGAWLLLGWTFLLGAVLGSFMNVVVYRLPRRMSLSYPGSRCPSCEHSIRWHDNVPIVGWLMLGGRCRDCKAAIPSRYPLVEALVAAVSAVVAWTAARDGVVTAPADMPVDALFVAGLYAFRMLFAGTLICAALIELDGHSVPRRLWAVALVVGFVAGSVWPDLVPIEASENGVWRGAIAAAVGLSAAGLLGALAWPGHLQGSDPANLSSALTAVAELALVGVFLGAGATGIVAAGAMVVLVVAQFWSTSGRLGWALALASFVYLTCWPEVAARWLSRDVSEGMVFTVCGALVALLAIVLRLTRAAKTASHHP